jgi:hypothetical protein
MSQAFGGKYEKGKEKKEEKNDRIRLFLSCRGVQIGWDKDCI